jgi:hypothetical protein
MSELFTKVVGVESVDAETELSMYRLLSAHYACTDFNRFCEDFRAKDTVILIFDKALNRLRGFSTIKSVTVTREDGVECRAIYSGDTIIEPAYWGNTALQNAFLKYLLLEKMKRPFQPLYWFLISKGYKTYLLMANNFSTHFPRYESETPSDAQSLMDAYGKAFFGDAYCGKTGLIVFEESLGQLRDGVAEITDNERKFPRIAFFESCNPGWREGAELACLAELTLDVPFKYVSKLVRKTFGRRSLSTQTVSSAR